MKKLSEEILDSAIKIHKALGPGLLESIYQNCLFYNLEKKNIKCEYEDLKFESVFCDDLIVDDKVIIEIKSLGRMGSIHLAQILTYLKLTNYPLGLLINFGSGNLFNGFSMFANRVRADDL